MAEYYRYSGDPAAIGLVTLTADYLLDYCQTPADHPWPGFLISCPSKGKGYGRANPHGFIQLDMTAHVGSGMVMAYKLTGDRRYREAARHWADLLAAHCDRTPGKPPWIRYANPKDVPWGATETAGISLTLQFLDDVIRLDKRGRNDALVAARDAGEKYLRDVLLPQWSRSPTFGHYFWDWDNAVHTCAVPYYTAQYMLGRREAFPEWKTDIRNFVSHVLLPHERGSGFGRRRLLRRVGRFPRPTTAAASRCRRRRCSRSRPWPATPWRPIVPGRGKWHAGKASS